MFEKIAQVTSLFTDKFSTQQWTAAQRCVDELPDKTERAAFRYSNVWSMLRKQEFPITA